ncbi:acyltransferase family protein [Lacticaseibacillus pabuli]|uniref:Acyltransferase family protein n=1 Tax=Lacticaseibacillus pabuli TaxID=3025672 RepID=A0ABY7WN49_9LACO|nr:acyltransferase family protein [Lacticaseibacillus sp. KACC 23028]WDF81615.1 acyltransferase family protein [Lacticaseibacillus sp. KACC 23028]
MSSQKKKRRYITGFDGLRTIGVLGVILYHLRPDLFRGGYLGVPIFMVVSGYLITDGLLREFDLNGKIDFKGFYIRRIKRLYPGLVAMLFGTAAYITFFARDLLHNLHWIVLTNLTYVYNWWQIANGQSYFARYANGESPFTHLWTLSIEGQFYWVWPLVVLLLLRAFQKRRGTSFNLIFLLAIISAVVMTLLYQPTAGKAFDPSRLYYGTDTRAFSILLGAALAFVWPSGRLAAKIRRSDVILLDVVGTVSFLAMIAMVMFMTDQSAWLYRGGMFVFSVFVTLLVAVVAHPGAHLNRVLSNPVFTWIGRRSYGIYLYQFPVMIFFESRMQDIADHVVLYPVIEVLIILALTEISYRLIEQPMAHFDYSNLGGFFGGTLWKPKNFLVTLASLLIIGAGAMGIAEAPGVKTDAADHSALAKQLTETSSQKAEKKKKLAALKSSIAESKRQNKQGSASSKAAESEAEKHPVNQEFEKYGLTQVELQKAQTIGITAIGDSVMKDGEPILQKIFPKAYIDAAVSRQMVDGLKLMHTYANQNALAGTILVGLGTNGPVTPQQLDELMHIAGPQRSVYWINVRVPTKQWQNDVNRTLNGAAKKYKNLHVIDWYDYANAHNDWFYADRVHPNTVGNPHYGAYIAKQIIDSSH